MKVLVCGDREWTDYRAIKKVLAGLPKRTIIIHGDCRGADKLAKKAAISLGLRQIPFPAEWRLYQRGAGVIRNTVMLKQKPKRVIAFHSNIAESKGTLDMVTQAVGAGVDVEFHK